MFIPKKLALLTTFGIFATGCSSSNGPADHPSAGAVAASAALPSRVATTAVSAGLIPLAAADLREARTASTDSCNIEALGKTTFGPAPVDLTEKSTVVAGWLLSAVSKKSGVPAMLRVVDISGTNGWQMPIGSWVARPDVTTTMHSVDLGNVGFSQAVDFSALPTGQYHLLVTFRDAGHAYLCDKGRMIDIK
jgi:hypothetical protein